MGRSGLDGLTQGGSGREKGRKQNLWNYLVPLSPSPQRSKGDSGASLANIGLLWRPCLWVLLAFDMLIGVKFQNVGKGNPLVIP